MRETIRSGGAKETSYIGFICTLRIIALCGFSEGGFLAEIVNPMLVTVLHATKRVAPVSVSSSFRSVIDGLLFH